MMNRHGLADFAMALAGAALLIGSPARAQAWSTTEHEITVDGLERSYLVHAPDDAAASPRPVMLVMHGGFGNAEGVEELYGMNAVAEREDFIAVYPNGPRIGTVVLRQRRTWNAGLCCGPAAEDDIDDVAFIRAMVDALVRDYGIDRDRVYASGMSNGGMMSYRLLCEAPDLIAAAVPVAGTLVLDDCAGGADVPLLHIHGAADDNVPVAGGVGGRALVDIDYRPLAETFAMLAEARDCAEPVRSTDALGTEVSIYACADGAPIEVMILPGVGHTWPGAEPRTLQRNRYDGEFSANEAAWAFASRYSQ